MMGGRCLTGVLFGALSASPVAAEAEACMTTEALGKNLLRGFSEGPVGHGFASGGMRGRDTTFQLYASDGGASWTFVQHFPNGMSCVVATGTDWGPTPPPPREKGDPT